MTAGYEVAIIIAGIGAGAVAVGLNARAVTPYAFLIGRIRAREARMLNDPKMQALLEAGSLESLMAGLRGTDYEGDLEGVGQDLSLIETALGRHLLRTHREVLLLVPKSTLPFFRKFSERLDLGNLRLVIHAVSGNVNRELAIAHLVDGMVFARDRLEVMAKSQDVPELIQQLSQTEYYEGLRGFLEPGEYLASDLIRALEHSYYASLWARAHGLGRKNRGIAQAIIGREIDLANLKLVVRLRLAGVGPDVTMKNVIPIEAAIKSDVLRACAQAESMDDVKTAAARTPLRSLLVPLLASGGDDVGVLERCLDEFLLDYCKAMSVLRPLTVATPLAYLYQKHAELGNVRALVRALGDGVPAAEMKQVITRSARIE